MADDYDYDDGAFIDMDDAWLYVEDEFDLAVSGSTQQTFARLCAASQCHGVGSAQ